MTDLEAERARDALLALKLIATIATEEHAFDYYAARYKVVDHGDFVTVDAIELDAADLVNLALVLCELARRRRKI